MPLADVKSAIAQWAETVTVKLVTDSESSDFTSTRTVTETSVLAMVQPTSMRERQALDLDLAVEHITLHIIPGGAVEELPLELGRYVEWQGTNYKVVDTKDHRATGGYFKAIAAEAREAIESDS